MAQLSGHLTADFSSFTNAVAGAQVSLRDFEGDAGKVERALQGMTDRFDGKKLIQDAILMAEAVEKIGGATTLTDAELQKLGRTAGEAVQKMERLGMEVPANLREIATAAKDAESATFDWRAALLSTAGAFGIAFSVNTLKNFALGVLDTGAAIGDLSVKLGISAEAVQRFKYAAEQNGTTIEAVGRMISYMNKTLAEGNDSTVAALEAVGLNFAEVRRQSPEEAFVALGDAAAGIVDPMQRAAFETQMFGKAGEEGTQLFLAGIRAVGDETRVMSDETIARLKAAQDAWGRLANAVTIFTGEIIADTIGMGTSLKDFMLGLSNFVVPSWLRGSVKEELNKIHDASEHAGKSIQLAAEHTATAGPTMAAGLAPATTAAQGTESAIRGMNEQATFSTQVFGFVEPKLGTLAEATRNMARGTDTLAESTDNLNSKLRFTSEVVGELPAKMAAATTAMATAAPTGPQMGTSSAGSVPFDMGNITYGTLGFARVFEEYQKKAASGGGALGGFVGGGPPKDFLTWALSMGLAQRAPTVTNTFNLVDTESNLARKVGDTITDQLQKGSLLT
jgi:hypothetical protein